MKKRANSDLSDISININKQRKFDSQIISSTNTLHNSNTTTTTNISTGSIGSINHNNNINPSSLTSISINSSNNSVNCNNLNENIVTIDKLLVPVDKPGVVRVLDRRINSYAFDEKISLYSLLRAWVQDDPDKPNLEVFDLFSLLLSIFLILINLSLDWKYNKWNFSNKQYKQ